LESGYLFGRGRQVWAELAQSAHGIRQQTRVKVKADGSDMPMLARAQ
jgi:hypothetical protein